MRLLLLHNHAVFWKSGCRIRFVFYGIWLLEIKRRCFHGLWAACLISDCLPAINYVRRAGRQCTAAALACEEGTRRFLTAAPHLLRSTTPQQRRRFSWWGHRYCRNLLILLYWNRRFFQCHWRVFVVFVVFHFGVGGLAFVRESRLRGFPGLLFNWCRGHSVRGVLEHFNFYLIANWHFINSYF